MSDVMRLSGISSGYDTEAMIEQMMSGYQTKIDNQNKKLTKLSWQQEAYRDVTTKLTDFKNKYFDILKKDNYLLSSTNFNKYTSTITSKTAGDKALGLSVTTTSASQNGNYKVKVSQLATATKISGKTLTPDSFKLDVDKAVLTGAVDEDGKYNFALDVKVGDVTETIEFEPVLADDGTVNLDETVNALNEQLKSAFGEIGDGNGTMFLKAKSGADGTIEFDVGGNATVSITEKTGNFGLATPSKSVAIATQSAVTGKNTVSVTVGGVTKTVSFEGVSDTYYDSRNESGNSAILAEYNALKAAAYRKSKNLSSTASVSQSDLDNFAYTSTQAAKDKNAAALGDALDKAFEDKGIDFTIDGSYVTAKKGTVNQEFSITSVEGGTLGLTKGTTGNKFSAKTKLTDMGIIGNAIDLDPSTGNTTKNYSFAINGVDIKLDADATINDLVNAVNKSTAGVTMSYSALTNSFTVTSNDMGSGQEIKFDSDNRILQELGIVDGTVTAGKNAIFELNGQQIYHNSNSYTLDGTTFKFDEDIELGVDYNVGVSKSYDDIKQTIKDFVTDYNQLIDDVYGHIGTAPKRDDSNNLYEPLTDSEKEEMSEDEIEKWEKAAKQGVIYNDSTISGIMSQIRTALYSAVELGDGSKFGLYNMGITTSSDYSEHGKLEIDEDKFNAAFENNAEAIEKLFTDADNGIMKKVNNILDNAVKTTGSVKGSLIRKAGLKSGSTSTDTSIYKEMQRITDRISQLQDRYDTKEEYWWKVFTNLESMMSDLNSQSTYLSSYLGGYTG